MKALEVLHLCFNALVEHQQRGTTIELFRRCFPKSKFDEHAFENIGETVDNIQDIDIITRDVLNEKLSRSLMDMTGAYETVGELLMIRLRLENAVRILTVLSKSKVETSISTTTDEEALLWALTTLWSAGRIQWASHTALAFSQHHDTAMPI